MKDQLEICILAGGLSRRMGRDKSRLRLGNRTMLNHIRAAAAATGPPVRLIRKDLVPRCGPLGGIYTALKTTSAHAVIFLACDMPFVTVELIQALIQEFLNLNRDLNRNLNLRPNSSPRPLFTRTNRSAGFPFVLPQTCLPVVTSQINGDQLSLQSLAKALKAGTYIPLKKNRIQLRNVNTPAEWRATQGLWLSTA